MTATDLRAARAADPSFDAEAFLSAVTGLFRDVRSAYSDGNLDRVTGRIAPELAAIFERQSRFLTGERTMSAVDAVAAELHGVEMGSDGELRTVVRFDVTGRLGAVALSADLPPATQLAGLPTRHWFEIWRLSRPCGFTTPPPATNCPSCGAPSTGESHCHYCNALLIDATANFRVDAIECMG
ncbi:MAG: TIM44-like domain-containing protein [Acidothermaceae bacterium]